MRKAPGFQSPPWGIIYEYQIEPPFLSAFCTIRPCVSGARQLDFADGEGKSGAETKKGDGGERGSYTSLSQSLLGQTQGIR